METKPSSVMEECPASDLTGPPSRSPTIRKYSPLLEFLETETDLMPIATSAEAEPQTSLATLSRLPIRIGHLLMESSTRLMIPSVLKPSWILPLLRLKFELQS